MGKITKTVLPGFLASCVFFSTSCGRSSIPAVYKCAGVTCGGHGSCHVIGGEPECVCDPGFYNHGLDCIQDPDPCEGVFCSGHGSCELNEEGLPSCECDDGYHNVGTFACVRDPGTEVCNDERLCLQQDIPTEEDLYAVWVTSTDNVIAAGDSGVILNWDGSTWSVMETGTDKSLYGLWGSDSDDIWAVGREGTILHWNGVTWSRRDSGTLAWLVDVEGTGPDDVWAVGEVHDIYKSTSVIHWDGRHWTDVGNSPDLSYTGSIWATTINDVWLAGSRFYHWDSDGWSRFYSVERSYIHDVWGSYSNNLWAVGNVYDPSWDNYLGIVIHWDGNSWLESGRWVVKRLHGVWGTGPDDIWAVGNHGGVFRWEGEEWREVDSGTWRRLNGVHGTESGQIWMVGDSGTVIRYD